MDTALLIVYGSLMTGLHNHKLLEVDGVTKISDISLKSNFKMVSLGSYPALIDSKNKNPINGELYEIPVSLIPALDRLEGHPNFYKREKIETKHGEAYIYILKDMYYATSARVVKNGDWRKFISDKI